MLFLSTVINVFKIATLNTLSGCRAKRYHKRSLFTGCGEARTIESMRSIAGWNHGTSTTLPRSMQRAVRYGPETATLGSRASKLNRLCRTDVRQVRLNTLVSAFIAASCHWKRYSIVATCGQSLPFSIDFLWIMLAS